MHLQTSFDLLKEPSPETNSLEIVFLTLYMALSKYIQENIVAFIGNTIYEMKVIKVCSVGSIE